METVVAGRRGFTVFAGVPVKVVILCGGKGMRIREAGADRPKPMIEIGGKPILWHIMKMYSHYGYNEFVLCLGYMQDYIKDYFLNYRFLNSDFTIELGSHESVLHHKKHGENWKITLVDTGLETKKGKRIKMVEEHLDGNRFMLTYGDGVGNVDVSALLRFHEQCGKKVTFTGVHPISRFATVRENERGEIVEWNEKMALEGFMNAGYFVMEKEVLDFIVGDCEFEEEPMQKLASQSQVAMYRHEGFWQCMDTLRDHVYLNDLWEKKKAPWRVWK